MRTQSEGRPPTRRAYWWGWHPGRSPWPPPGLTVWAESRTTSVPAPQWVRGEGAWTCPTAADTPLAAAHLAGESAAPGKGGWSPRRARRRVWRAARTRAWWAGCWRGKAKWSSSNRTRGAADWFVWASLTLGSSRGWPAGHSSRRAGSGGGSICWGLIFWKCHRHCAHRGLLLFLNISRGHLLIRMIYLNLDCV